jgi:hypothetical protein
MMAGVGAAVVPAAYGDTVDMPSPAAVARYAQWLLEESDPGDWSGPAVERLAGAHGGSGAARVVPAGEAEARYLGGRGCRELAVAVTGQARVPEPWAAFRGVGAELAQALGPPSSLGSYGLAGPWGMAAPSWGSPFLQWRRPRDRTLELRASEDGADLVLQPTGPVEAWRKDWHEWSGRPAGGFVIARSVPGNEGLYLPGVPRAGSWKQLQLAMASFLGRLPAETAALALPFHAALCVGTASRMQITSGADGALSIRAGFRSAEDPAALGWTRVPAPAFPWLLDAGGPGTVDGPSLAGTLISSLRADKVRSPARLSVTCPADGHAIIWGLSLGPDLFHPAGNPARPGG